jgi:hypothetical protein
MEGKLSEIALLVEDSSLFGRGLWGGGSIPEKARWAVLRNIGRAALAEVEPMREATFGANMRVEEAIVMMNGDGSLEMDGMTVGGGW